MPVKKRFFTRNKKSVYHSPQDRTSLGNKSVNTRESIRLAKLAQDKNKKKKVDSSLQAKRGNLIQNGLPNISLTITERLSFFQRMVASGFSLKKLAATGFCLILVVLSFWQGYLLLQKSLAMQAVIVQRSILTDEMGLWEGIAQKYPTYRDAYFQASVLAYRLGDTVKEQQLLDKTLQLDPNYLPAQNLEKISH